MRKIIRDEWEYNGDFFKLGDLLSEKYNFTNNAWPIVCYKNRIYRAVVKPSFKGKDRVGLWDIFDEKKKPYWTTTDNIYQVIKLPLSEKRDKLIENIIKKD